MIKNWSYSFIFIFIIFISCKNNSSIRRGNRSLHYKTDAYKILNAKDSAFLLTDVQKIRNRFSFLHQFPVKKTPIIDSTNFNSVNNVFYLNKKQIQLLQLKKVIPTHVIEYVDKIYANYLLHISDNFISIVVYYYFGENELYTTLVNYTLHYKIIDWKIIAYDEVAENWFRIQSYIYPDKIIVKNISFVEANPGVETENYVITEKGKIIKK